MCFKEMRILNTVGFKLIGNRAAERHFGPPQAKKMVHE
jgi:hypothetical protein